MRLVPVLIATVILSNPIKAWSKDFSINLYTGAQSSYLLDNGIAFHDGPVLQSEILISLPKGFYLDLWHSMGMDGSGLSSGLDDELDYTAGWRGDVRGYSLDMGVLYMDMIKVLDLPDGDIMLPYFEVSRNLPFKGKQLYNPYVKIQPGLPANGSYPAGGLYVGVGLRHLYQISKALRLGEEFALIHDSGAFGFESGKLFKYAVGVNRKLPGPFSLDMPMFKFIAPVSGMSDRKKETSVGIRLGISL